MAVRRRSTLIFFGIIFLLFVFGSSLLGFYTEWLWFQSLGYAAVFLRLLNFKFTLALVMGLVSGLIFYINGRILFRLAHQTAPAGPSQFPFNIPVWLEEQLQRFLKPAAILIGIVFGMAAAGQWENLQLFRNALTVGTKDPVFQQDLSFYLFRLPFWGYLSGWFGGLWFVCLIAAVAIILIRFQFQYSEKGFSVQPWVKKYFAALLGVLFIYLAFYFYLARYDMLFTGRGVVFGPGFVDQHYVLPAMNLMVIVSALTGLVFFSLMLKPGGKALTGVLAAFIAIYLIGIYLLPGVVQRFVVTPNEIHKESPFLARYIQGTLQGYGLDRVEERQLSAATSLSPALIENNQLTVKNIRLWDHHPLLETFGQIQEIRTYYKFQAVDNDRYLINNEYRQVMLSPRELSYADLPSKGWINEHLVYTHGYGLTLGVVNQVTPEGLPSLLIQDIPPVSKTNLQVTQPEIYFGEIENDYIIVNTRQKEFNYPSGDQNVFASYQGKGGIRMGGFLKKVLWAARFGSFKIYPFLGYHPGKPGSFYPFGNQPGSEDRPFSAGGSRSLYGRFAGKALLDRRRLYPFGKLSLLPAYPEDGKLYPQRGGGGGGRL